MIAVTAKRIAVMPTASGRIASMKRKPPADFFFAAAPSGAAAGAAVPVDCGATAGASRVTMLFCACAMKLVMSCAL